MTKTLRFTLCANFFSLLYISDMLAGTVDSYHVVPLSVALTLAKGHKTSRKLNFLLHFLTHFSTNQDEI